MLEAWLDFHRQTLPGKCSGLTAGHLRQRAAPPSTLSLLGLIRHMTPDVERGWFRRRVAGQDVGFPAPARLTPTASSTTSTRPTPSTTSAPTGVRSNLPARPAAGWELDETFFHSRRNAQMSVRWVYVHMIEEYSRHNGHADLLRERIDGTTGF